jgi:hypothetical protein
MEMISIQNKKDMNKIHYLKKEVYYFYFKNQ